MLHLCHVATVVQEHHFRIGELTCRSSSTARIDEHIVLAVDRQHGLGDPGCQAPGTTRTTVGECREEPAKRPQEGIRRVGQGIAVRRLDDESVAQVRRDARGIGRAGIERRLDALIDRDSGVATHERLPDARHRDHGQVRVAAADAHRR